MMRAAITGPIPGTVVSSFSVAVLMSILPNGVFAFACELLALPLSPGRIAGVGFGVERRIGGETKGAKCCSAGMKEPKADGLSGRTFNRPMLMPQAPIFSCLA